MESILKYGLDPGRRCGQAYGQGEYFSWSPRVSEPYCRRGGGGEGDGESILIVFAVLMDDSGITAVSVRPPAGRPPPACSVPEATAQGSEQPTAPQEGAATVVVHRTDHQLPLCTVPLLRRPPQEMLPSGARGGGELENATACRQGFRPKCDGETTSDKEKLRAAVRSAEDRWAERLSAPAPSGEPGGLGGGGASGGPAAGGADLKVAADGAAAAAQAADLKAAADGAAAAAQAAAEARAQADCVEREVRLAQLSVVQTQLRRLGYPLPAPRPEEGEEPPQQRRRTGADEWVPAAAAGDEEEERTAAEDGRLAAQALAVDSRIQELRALREQQPDGEAAAGGGWVGGTSPLQVRAACAAQRSSTRTLEAHTVAAYFSEAQSGRPIVDELVVGHFVPRLEAAAERLQELLRADEHAVARAHEGRKCSATEEAEERERPRQLQEAVSEAARWRAAVISWWAPQEAD